MSVAAVDIGTNTVRLLISSDGNDLVRRAEVVGLGRGLAQSGKLNPKGRRLALEVFAEFAEAFERYDVSRCRAVATSASRDASDSDAFLVAVEGVLGLRPEIISGADEAALSYLGATAELAGDDWTVVDIGGGSTEIISANGGDSFNVGSVRLTDRFLSTRPVQQSVIESAREWVASLLGAGNSQAAHLVGVAGTWTTLAALEMELEPYEPQRVHHYELSRDAVTAWAGRLAQLSIEETAHLPGMAKARAPVILGGVIVAESVMRLLAADVCLVSERDLLDGIVARLVDG